MPVNGACQDCVHSLSSWSENSKSMATSWLGLVSDIRSPGRYKGAPYIGINSRRDAAKAVRRAGLGLQSQWLVLVEVDQQHQLCLWCTDILYACKRGVSLGDGDISSAIAIAEERLTKAWGVSHMTLLSDEMMTYLKKDAVPSYYEWKHKKLFSKGPEIKHLLVFPPYNEP